MGKVLLGFAIVFIVIGVGAYALSGAASVTALIPAFFGALIGLCAAAALAKPSWARGATATAGVLGIAAFGGIASRVGRGFASEEGFAMDLAGIAQLATAVAALALVVWSIGAFVRSAGRSRAGGERRA